MMDETIEARLCDVMELPPGDRLAAVDSMADLSPEAKNELRRLLAMATDADEYFTDISATSRKLTSQTPTDHAAMMCGPYKLIRKIGEGGFGLVWLAVQHAPIKRMVAVKVIKAGMDSAEVIARFDAEKHALARMDHPNIAKVLDAGITEHGRPFFVMELVEGQSITQYCAEHGLGVRDRLALFGDVCSAINHAHQKGVIHRDIKPSNVIITECESKPLAKVIDFGIAKAIDGNLTDHTLFTRIEQWLGTPAYMSPEQAGMGFADVDTRSDIYALGVLLYELITGATPFDATTLMKAGYEEMRRIIREDEPPRPSQRLATSMNGPAETVARSSGATGKFTAKTLSMELDWIVMKAMEKARERRYETAAALAGDVGRFLADLPVEARPPGRLYLMAKFARRHRTTMLAGVTFIAMLITSVVVSSWQAVRARNAEQLAQTRMHEALHARNEKDAALEDSKAVTRLLSEVFRRTDPEVDGRMVTVADALDAATATLDEELRHHPERHAMLLEVLAETYEQLGIIDKAIELRRQVLEIRKPEKETSSNKYLDAIEILIAGLSHVGEYAEARDLGVDRFALCMALHGPHNVRTLQAHEQLALDTFRSGKYADAIEIQDSLARNLQDILPPAAPRLMDAVKQLKKFCKASGDLEQLAVYQVEFAIPPADDNLAETSDADDPQWHAGLEAARRKVDNLDEEHGRAHPKSLTARMELADLLIQSGNRNEAVELHIQITEDAAELYGEYHPNTLKAVEQCMLVAMNAHSWRTALRMREKAARIHDLTFGIDHIQALRFHHGRIFDLSLNRRPEEGIELAEKIMDEYRTVMGPHSDAYMEFLCNYARCLASAGRSRDAMAVFAIACPNMTRDTYVNKYYAALLRWHGEIEEYDRVRDRSLRFFHENRHRYMRSSYVLEKCVLIASMHPLENPEHTRMLADILRDAEERMEAPDFQVPMYYRPWWSKVVHAVGNYRIGNHELALQRFDEAEAWFARNPDRQLDPNAWHHQTRLIYEPLILLAMGQENEARAMFLENLTSINRWQDEEEPLKGHTLPDGISLTRFIALREALEVFGIDPPFPSE